MKTVFIVFLLVGFIIGFMVSSYTYPTKVEPYPDFGANFDSKFNSLDKGTLLKVAEELDIDILAPDHPFGNVSVASYTREGEFVNHRMAFVSFGFTFTREYDSEKMAIVLALESMTKDEREKSDTLKSYYVE